MRAIIINAEERTVSEAEIDGSLKSLQQIVGGLIDPVYPGLEDTGHHCYVNDEGLLNNPQHFFMLKDGHQPLAGNGVILGDDNGDEAPATLPLDWVKERVTFMDLQAVREWAAREPDQPNQQAVGSFVGEEVRSSSPDAKPLPPDPENMNNDRAEYAAAALRHFQCTTGSDYDDSLTDLLGDLMHWSDRNGVDFSAELERARGHYGAETTPTTEQAIKEPGARETADTGEAQHSRWTGEPLGEGAAAGPTQSKGQSH